jgi:subtilisin
MLRRGLVLLLAVCLVPLTMSSPAAPGSGVPTGRYLVVLKDPAAGSDVAGAARRLGGTVHDLFATVRTLVVSLPRSNLAALRRDPRVAYVVPDLVVRLVADDGRGSLSAVPAGVARIGAAPRRGGGGSVGPSAGPKGRAAVALLDTGVMNRPDLNMAGGYDCLGSDTTEDRNGHGTHVAGIVADEGPDLIGVSPGTPLYAVRVFGADGAGPISNVVCGLDWVAEHASADNIKVVNLSLTGPGFDDGNCGHTDQDPLHSAVCRVVDAGVTVVAAAGNDRQDLAQSTPAAYREVLAVTAMADFDGRPGGLGWPPPDCLTSDKDDTPADYSDYALPGSPDADHTLAAPGDCITATWNDGRTKTLSGTSMASPHVAGLVARCIDGGPCAGLSPARVIAKLRADAASRPPAWGFAGDPNHPVAGKYYGYLATDLGY